MLYKRHIFCNIIVYISLVFITSNGFSRNLDPKTVTYTNEIPENYSVLHYVSRYDTGVSGMCEMKRQLQTSHRDHYKTKRDVQPQVYKINSETEYIYYKPHFFDFISDIPGSISTFTKIVFQKKNIPIFALIAGSTIITIGYDQYILNETQSFGRGIGLKGTNRMQVAFKVFGQPIEVPRDLDTGMYFLGDGWTDVIITGSFLTYGLIANDNRALQTTSQLAQGLILVGVTTQLLKHITGRESPFVSSRSGGRWVFFPNQIEYHQHVPNYDAFPSGHLATAMMMVTVISENYKEKKWIKPLGYTLMTILAFEMVNNGVHWISDYPLALGIGYAFGKAIASRGHTERNMGQESFGMSQLFESIKIYPAVDFRGGIGLKLSLGF